MKIHLQNGWKLHIENKSKSTEPTFKVKNRFGETFVLTANQVFFSKELSPSHIPHFKLQVEHNQPMALTIRPYLGLKGGNPDDEDLEDECKYHNEKKYLNPFVKAFCELPEQIQNKLKNKLPIDPISYQQEKNIPVSIQALFKHAWSFQAYMRESLYGPNGYFSAGKVGFQSGESDVGDFMTCATESPHLAKQMTNQSFMMWRRMVEAGDIQSDEPFTLLENGGGEGYMANHILTYLQEHFAKSNHPEMEQFAKVVSYKIVEISPALIERTTERNQSFIEEGKLKIYQGDASCLTKIFAPKELKGLAFSNELVDNFPLHQIRLNDKREVEVLMAVPCLENLEILAQKDPKLARRLEKKSIFLDELYENLPVSKERKGIFISIKDMKYLPQEMLKEIMWHHVYIPGTYIPEVRDYIENQGLEYFRNMKAGDKAYINTMADSFIESLDAVLDKGFVMTIDYGYHHDKACDRDSKDRKIPLSTYTSGRHDPITNPHLGEKHNNFGESDLTVRVNFTVLAETGIKYGLNPIAFMSQGSLEHVMDPAIEMEKIATPEHQKSKQHGVPFFNVLIQQKKSTKACFLIPGESTPVTHLQLKNFSNPQLEMESRFHATVLHNFMKTYDPSSDNLNSEFKSYLLKNYFVYAPNSLFPILVQLIRMSENERTNELVRLKKSNLSIGNVIAKSLEYYFQMKQNSLNK